MKDTDPQKGKVGLREIASAAKVSIATASRVLNGNSRVDPNIQKAVLHEAKKLGVDPSQRNKGRTLVFLLGNRAMPHAFHSRILSGAEAHCAVHGWNIVFLSFDYSPAYSLAGVAPAQSGPAITMLTRAVILAGTNSTNLTSLLAHKGIPFVVFGNNVIGEQQDLKNNDVVLADDIQGCKDAVRYLIGLGHRQIWYVGNTRLPWFKRCYEGYHRAMEEAGLTPRESATDRKTTRRADIWEPSPCWFAINR